MWDDVYRDLSDDVIRKNLKQGAEYVEVTIISRKYATVSGRLDKIESVQSQMNRNLGLRLYRNSALATASSSDLSSYALDSMIEECHAAALHSQPDDANRLPDMEMLGSFEKDLGIFDPLAEEPDLENMKKTVLEAENIAQDFDPRIVNSEGSSFTAKAGELFYANSAGFSRGFRSSRWTLMIQPVVMDDGSKAMTKGRKQTDFWFAINRKYSDLSDVEKVAVRAAGRTLRKIGSRKPKTEMLPILFDQLTASEILSHLFTVISGSSLYRKASFLAGKKGEKIAADIVSIYDDPFILSGMGSRPFDGEGMLPSSVALVEDGILRLFLHNRYSAARTGDQPTGHAGFSASDRPPIAYSNMYILPGKTKLPDIIRDIKRGIYITSLTGQGFEPASGYFSRGASGIMIENGQLTFPISEFTLAGSLQNILGGIIAIADDPVPGLNPSSPSLLVKEMQCAGAD